MQVTKEGGQGAQRVDTLTGRTRRRRAEKRRFTWLVLLSVTLGAATATALEAFSFNPLSTLLQTIEHVRHAYAQRFVAMTAPPAPAAIPTRRTVALGPRIIITPPFGYSASVYAGLPHGAGGVPSARLASTVAAASSPAPPFSGTRQRLPGTVANPGHWSVRAPSGTAPKTDLAAFEPSTPRHTLDTAYLARTDDADVWTAPLEAYDAFETALLQEPFVPHPRRPSLPESRELLLSENQDDDPSRARLRPAAASSPESQDGGTAAGTIEPASAQPATDHTDVSDANSGAKPAMPATPKPTDTGYPAHPPKDIEQPPSREDKPDADTEARPKPAEVDIAASPVEKPVTAVAPQPNVDVPGPTQPDAERPKPEAPNGLPITELADKTPQIERPAATQHPDIKPSRIDLPIEETPDVERPEAEPAPVAPPDRDRPTAERPVLARSESPAPEVPTIERSDVARPDTGPARTERPELERGPDERPAPERPAIELPDVAVPDIERPAVDRPEVLRPDAERPELERPEIERPETERPEIERPEIDSPDIDIPDIERPDIERPGVERPDTERPDVERPDVERPDIERPDVERPDVERPDIERPDIERPDIERPDVERPDVERPDVERPDIERPDVERPDIERPDIERPDIERPDVERPDVERPDIERPDVERPDIERPDVERPDIERPDVERPDIERPDIERPDIERPDIERPDIERPDIERPDIERPDIERPDIERPDIERPDIERPDIERPDRD